MLHRVESPESAAAEEERGVAQHQEIAGQHLGAVEEDGGRAHVVEAECNNNSFTALCSSRVVFYSFCLTLLNIYHTFLSTISFGVVLWPYLRYCFRFELLYIFLLYFGLLFQLLYVFMPCAILEEITSSE